MNNELEASTYKTWFQKFKEEKAKLELALNGKNKPQLDTRDDLIQRLLPELSNLHQIYEKGNIIQKQTLIRGAKIICYGVMTCLEPLLSIQPSMITY